MSCRQGYVKSRVGVRAYVILVSKTHSALSHPDRNRMSGLVLVVAYFGSCKVKVKIDMLMKYQ